MFQKQFFTAELWKLTLLFQKICSLITVCLLCGPSVKFLFIFVRLGFALAKKIKNQKRISLNEGQNYLPVASNQKYI